MSSTFRCSSCGDLHAGPPLVWGPEAPVGWHDDLVDDETSRLDDDLCVIRGEAFYVRGRLELPVVDGDGPFAWLVWVSLSRENFALTLERWQQPGREHEAPMFGWLSSSLPGYPQTAGLKTMVHARPVGERPFIEVEHTEHPLAQQQHTGVTTTWIRELAEHLLHSGDDA